MTKERDIVTGLTRQGTAEFGSQLIAKAQQTNRESLEKSVVGHVETILMQIQKQTEYMVQCESNLKLLREKVAALKSGAFKLSPYGVITFDNKALQEGVLGMKECVNCGANLQKYGSR